MKKIKYYFNTHTLRYEKFVTPLRVKLLRIFGFVAAVLVTGFIIMNIAYRLYPSANEKFLRLENDRLKKQYSLIAENVKTLQQEMSELERRDNDVYRSIFEAKPIPDSIRLKEMEKNKELQLVQSINDENKLISSLGNQLNTLNKQVAFQQKSYTDIENMVKNKEKLLEAIPAIQPVSNKDLNRIASGFGYRIDPVYKVTKMHAGLDFTAPQGTPIYATANGTVSEAEFNTGGYGNMVKINHGYGYETLYGHMYRVKARRGQKVLRGDVIGYVGSTGKSTGPHCHYEVHKGGTPVNPVYYFYNDLNAEQYDRILQLAESSNQSLD
jgi:murein DD-endopeptidase MepM/ murein hydrolase activator NlpD